MTIRKRILATVLVLTCLFATVSVAQEKAKGKSKSYIFHGKVEAVTEKGLTVNGEKVEGWMEAMTMSYPVDKPDVLKASSAEFVGSFAGQRGDGQRNR